MRNKFKLISTLLVSLFLCSCAFTGTSTTSSSSETTSSQSTTSLTESSSEQSSSESSSSSSSEQSSEQSSTSSSSSSQSTSSSETSSSSSSSSSSSTSVIEISPFPSKEVILFFEDAGVDVVVTDYVSSNAEIVYEIDDSYEGYLDVYVTGSSHEEMVTYKDLLVEDGWFVVAESEYGDFRLQYGESIAYVDLLDYEEYILVSFYCYIPSEIEYTVETAIDAVAELLSELLGESVEATHTEEEHYILLNFGSEIDAETMKLYSDYFFVPEGFEPYQSDWQSDEFSDGTPVEYIDYICGDVALEYLVYTVESPALYAGLYYEIDAFYLYK